MKKLLLLSPLFFFALSAAAQADSDTLKPPLLSGYADVYYKYNFNKNASDNKTSFTNSQHSFELGMVSLKVQHDFGKVSFLGNVAFGKRADEFSYNASGSSIAIEQLYVSYAPADWVTLSMGSFSTHVGYELPDANANRNYSMSYLFSFGPFFHTGVKADFTAGDHSLMVGVFNQTDYKYGPPGGKKYLGAQWGYAPEDGPFASYLNYIGGTSTDDVRGDQVDLVLTYQFSPAFGLAYDGSAAREKPQGADASSWWGSALYLNADLSSHTRLTLRGEYFDDADGLKVFTDRAAFPDGGNVWAFTLSGGYQLGPLTIIPEVRVDYASGPLFTNGQGNPVRSSPGVLVAAIYSF